MTNPIAAAVAPIKDLAIARAEQDATNFIARLLANLEAANWDLNVVAPRPLNSDDRATYLAKSRKIGQYQSITTYSPDQTFRRVSDPYYRVRSETAEALFVKTAKELAAQQYDTFVEKLIHKIGAVETASLHGEHVWGHSILTVAKADGSTERWKTQQIVNVSKLGTLFNQWPSRKVK